MNKLDYLDLEILHYKRTKIIERTEDIIDEQDANKLLEISFSKIKKQNLYAKGLLDQLKSNIYIHKD